MFDKKNYFHLVCKYIFVEAALISTEFLAYSLVLWGDTTRQPGLEQQVLYV